MPVDRVIMFTGPGEIDMESENRHMAIITIIAQILRLLV
jgi:hypothetical protein